MQKLLLFTLILLTFSCNKADDFKINNDNISPGSKVQLGKNQVQLYSGSIKVGDNLNSFFNEFFKDKKIDKVSVINIVPSIDTPVCEGQTHSLGESGLLNSTVGKFTISSDLPMAQKRFAKEAKLENINYISDYKEGLFGKKTGLLMKGNQLLARAVLVTDAVGVIKYIQIVSNIAELPNMDKAYKFANELLKK
jgi:thiol peroxidase